LTTTTATSATLARQLKRVPFRLLALVLLVSGSMLVLSSPALAAKKPVSCGQQVINDWEDGQIDRSYPERCYREALKLVPDDAQEYSSLPTDLERALQSLTSKGVVPGHQVGNPFGSKYRAAIVYAHSISRLAAPYNHRDEVALPESDATPLGNSGICIIAGCGGSAKGLPLPLLILGGLAFLLLAAGTVGMVMRRMQERRLPPPDNA
jgi:hypothetical protein